MKDWGHYGPIRHRFFCEAPYFSDLPASGGAEETSKRAFAAIQETLGAAVVELAPAPLFPLPRARSMMPTKATKAMTTAKSTMALTRPELSFEMLVVTDADVEVLVTATAV